MQVVSWLKTFKIIKIVMIFHLRGPDYHRSKEEYRARFTHIMAEFWWCHFATGLCKQYRKFSVVPDHPVLNNNVNPCCQNATGLHKIINLNQYNTVVNVCTCIHTQNQEYTNQPVNFHLICIVNETNKDSYWKLIQLWHVLLRSGIISRFACYVLFSFSLCKYMFVQVK